MQRYKDNAAYIQVQLLTTAFLKVYMKISILHVTWNVISVGRHPISGRGNFVVLNHFRNVYITGIFMSASHMTVHQTYLHS